jgi:cation diffusion facilitator family transporter
MATEPVRESNTPIYASIAANVVIAAAKFTAAVVSRSSAMTAEGVHSLVDACDGLLLLVGRKRSEKPADARHPFGFGGEAYFWTLMVAIVFFAVGGGMSVYEGILHIMHPEPLRDPTWNYVVLGVALLFDGASWIVAVRHFRRGLAGRGWIEAMRRSKDPTLYSVVLEDSADLAGIALAFCGVFFSHRLGMPELDGAASVGVGLVLATVAGFLVIQCKGLLIGESATPELVERIQALVGEDPAVHRHQCPISMQLGPAAVMVGLRIRFNEELRQSEISAAARRIQKQIRDRHPEVRYVYFDVLGEDE